MGISRGFGSARGRRGGEAGRVRSARGLGVERLEERRLLTTIQEFAVTPGSQPFGIAQGPDGNLWFTETNGSRVGRITPPGMVTEFSTGITPGSQPLGIALGPDGNLWFTEFQADKIGRITPGGVVTEFSTGITPGAAPGGIVNGPDNNLWFTEFDGSKIGRITPAGVVTEFPTGTNPGLTPGSQPAAITVGSDGSLWFTEPSVDQIGRITPAGVVTEFSTGISPGSQPAAITAGPDGNLWFTEFVAGRIGRITTTGTVTEFSTGITPFSQPTGIAPGPDGNLWFTEFGADKVGLITPDGTVTELSAGITPGASPAGIVAGPDGNLWFTEEGGDRIGRVDLAPPTVSTITRVTSLQNPSLAGGQATFLAVVTPASGSVQPTGSLNIYVDNNLVGGAALQVINGVSQALFNTPPLTAGAHVIKAKFVGSTGFAHSLSDPLIQNVIRATSSVLSGPSSVTPSVPVTFTAVVTVPDGAPGTPTGTVSFFLDGRPQSSVPLGPSGRVTFTFQGLAAGPHQVVAGYNGDRNFQQSFTHVFNVTSSPVPTVTSLVASAGTVTFGQPVTFTATVSAVPPLVPGSLRAKQAAGLPPFSGRVTFEDGTTPLATVAVNAGGVAAFTTAALGPGRHAITAVFGNDPAYQPSTSKAVTETVNPVPVPVQTDGPRVVSVVRLGYHWMPTTLVLFFNRPLNPASAQDTRNYLIFGPWGWPIPVASAAYVPAANAVVLQPVVRLDLHRTYVLFASGAGPLGVRDAFGNLLDGAGNGRPGSHFVTTVNIFNWFVPGFGPFPNAATAFHFSRRFRV